jgi:transposase
MEKWTEVRRRVLTGELSKRAACQEYGINWRTLVKMLAHAEPPGYRRKVKREQPVVGPHLAWIHEVLEHDKQEPVKQRHTAKRIFDRLKVERGYTGGYTMVKEVVRTWKDATKEVFVPLSHPPGEAQVDFGFAYVDVAVRPSRGRSQGVLRSRDRTILPIVVIESSLPSSSSVHSP